jgi:hypothetical protein
MNTFAEEEIPTRPDLPRSAARKCKHCGLVFGEHADIFPKRPDAECFGVKCNFEPEKSSHGDRER